MWPVLALLGAKITGALLSTIINTTVHPSSQCEEFLRKQYGAFWRHVMGARNPGGRSDMLHHTEDEDAVRVLGVSNLLAGRRELQPTSTCWHLSITAGPESKDLAADVLCCMLLMQFVQSSSLRKCCKCHLNRLK
jgi:hypothetical protein